MTDGAGQSCVELGWPDLEYLSGILFGFALSGCLDRPAIFRTTSPQTCVRYREELLADSSAFIDSLESSMGPSADADTDTALYDHTQKGRREVLVPAAHQVRSGHHLWQRPMATHA